MGQWVMALEAVDRAHASRVGDKAAALGTLLKAGFPVPPGLCVTVESARLALAEFHVEIDAILDHLVPRSFGSAQQAADEITKILDDLTLPPEVALAVQVALPQIAAATTALAVRSSALGEDGDWLSLAGQHSSVIGVYGASAVCAAIVACWRSFFSPHALFARAWHGTFDASAAMAVLIQPVIQAECAGVCYSVDPVQRQRDRVVVNAAWGLGIGVADGSVVTDTAWVRRSTLDIERHQVNEKTEQVTLDAAGRLCREPVPPERRRAACLPDEWLSRVAQFAIAAESLQGVPQDVEWAILKDQVWLLQSRPLTGLPAQLKQATPFPVSWDDDEERRAFWWCDTQGLHDDLLLPLEQDEYVRREGVRAEACRLLGVERNQQHKFVNGRAYARHIPMDWMAGERRIRRAAHEDLLARLQRQGLTTWDYWGPEIISATERLRAFNPGLADGPALAEHLEDALAVRRRHYMLHPACSFVPGQSFFDAYAAVTGVNDSEAREAARKAVREAAYQFIDAGETPLSQLIEALYGLARTAQDAGVVDLITNPPPDVLERLAVLSQGRVFLNHFDAFLDIYGERTGNGWGSEVTLRMPTWREQPEKVLAFIRPYLQPQVEPPSVIRSHVHQAIDARVERLCAACDDPAAVEEFRRQLAYARNVAAVLELHNHYIDQMSIGQLRQAVMAAGRWLVAQGTLTSAQDVLWLNFDELLSALRTDAPYMPASGAYAALIAARQQQHTQWSQMEAPPFLGVPEARLHERPQLGDDVSEIQAAGGTRLFGQGASAGQAHGRARVVEGITALQEIERGAILVASNVGPLWTPLFPLLGGLILESGSVGQHAATTAREYGIPAVVNVKRAVQRIPNGAWVTIDGATGTIEVDNR